MPNTRKSAAIADRDDLSQFVVHLTRDLPGFGGATAAENFASILLNRRIEARNPHCLYSREIEKLSAGQKQHFRVACFTEIPLNQIHLLTRRIEGRDVRLQPYGFVFRKEVLIDQGAQPAIYINSYGGNSWLYASAKKLYQHAMPIKPSKMLWRLLPFINAMHEGYDFSWEREWRLRETLEFEMRDVVCVILPEDEEDVLRHEFARQGMAVISPGWRYKQIVSELAKQQRKTRNISRRKVEELAKRLERGS